MSPSDVRMEVDSGRLRMAVLPGHGGRIVSLFDMSSGREWLTQTNTPDASGYGASFTHRVIHGWDELVPSIDSCFIDGARIPDHGEIWAVSWQVLPARRMNGIRLQGSCVAVPLVLEREISPLADGGIVLEYRMRNTGKREYPAIWAAHPQFAVSRAARLRIAPTPDFAYVDSPQDRRVWHDVEAEAKALRHAHYLKARIVNRGAESVAEIIDGSERLSLSWAGDSLRWTAILWDIAAFAPRRVIAIEPTTGERDSASESHSRDGCLVLPPDGIASWTLTLRVPE